MSRAASLPGAELFLRNPTFLEEATCPRQLRCLGQNFFSEIRLFLKKPLVPGSFAAWGRTFSQKSDFFGRSHLSRAASLPGAELFLRNPTFLKKPLVPGSFAAWGKTFSQKSDFFEEATCPGQLRCLGQIFFSEFRLFFEQATCPRQLRCLGQNFFSKKN